MSFRLFIYYCALCGGWAALLAWGLGEAGGFYSSDDYVRACAYGGMVGLFVSAAVGTLDAILNAAPGRRLVPILVSLTVGLLGGVGGGMLGQFLHSGWGLPTFLGWMTAGLAIGASIGVYDWIRAMRRRKDLALALKKIRNGVLGGALGGMLGGLFFSLAQRVLDLPRASLATGLVILGVSVGLLIGLAQVILKEAWVRIESGKRAGREMMLSKEETTIGRAETCDIGLFGDNAVERIHARILLQDQRYLLTNASGSGATLLNGGPVTAPTVLQSGDEIRVGNSVLRFGERRKQPVS